MPDARPPPFAGAGAAVADPGGLGLGPGGVVGAPAVTFASAEQFTLTIALEGLGSVHYVVLDGQPTAGDEPSRALVAAGAGAPGWGGAT